MTPEAIHDALRQRFGEAIAAFDADAIDPTVTVEASAIHDVGALSAQRAKHDVRFAHVPERHGLRRGAEQSRRRLSSALDRPAARHHPARGGAAARRRGADRMRRLAHRRMA